ncbi:hypothetical protein ACIRPT_34365 [Streptomyces sp. NPDC101227]|uniref:hypothetical protein n=1 Tax=Streptomyces sp. NPDC101227 TaxID=3366136 RepID=UPI003813F170
MNSAPRRIDLAAFLAVLATGIVLISAGVQPAALSPVALGLSALYAAWQHTASTARARGRVRAVDR